MNDITKLECGMYEKSNYLVKRGRVICTNLEVVQGQEAFGVKLEVARLISTTRLG